MHGHKQDAAAGAGAALGLAQNNGFTRQIVHCQNRCLPGPDQDFVVAIEPAGEDVEGFGELTVGLETRISFEQTMQEFARPGPVAAGDLAQVRGKVIEVGHGDFGAVDFVINME